MTEHKNQLPKQDLHLKVNWNIWLIYRDITFMVNVLKFRTKVVCQKGRKQTVQTQIRLLLEEPSYQCLPFAILTSIPALTVYILFENRKRKVLEILEHLPLTCV